MSDCFNTYDEYDLRYALRADKIDLGMSWTGDMDMRRHVILGTDDEAKPMGAVNDHHLRT